ncbi:MAG TPA: glycosyltransferase family 2 protein [Candidatus Saccharimonadales bacterium]|nr:glycosyltransferase family 2 protein [Candidatus Saccharimonadales bacterium]
MDQNTRKVTVIVPCYNEAEGIGSVLGGFNKDELRRFGYTLDIIVVDNNSTDATAEIAARMGARVITERAKGKGNAMRTGFRSITPDTDYVVMLDGDDTYSSKEILRMLEPLRSGFGDVIIGSRLCGKIHDNSMTMFNRFGNWLYTTLVRIFYRANVSDVLTGYFAWNKVVIDALAPNLTSPGFAIEMEMITKMARMNCEMYAVPISYHPRHGVSNLHPIQDGYRILKMFLKNLVWNPPTEVVPELQDAQASSEV